MQISNEIFILVSSFIAKTYVAIDMYTIKTCYMVTHWQWLVWHTPCVSMGSGECTYGISGFIDESNI